MQSSSRQITFVVPGKSKSAGQPTTALRGTVKASVRVGARRGAGDSVRVTAQPGEDIVLVHLSNGPTLYLHPENARDLFSAQESEIEPARGANQGPSDEVQVPAQLGWPTLADATAGRGKVVDWIRGAVVGSIEVITGLLKDQAVSMAAAAVTRKLDGQVDAGVYQLSPASLGRLKGTGEKLTRVPAPPKTGAPLLVLVHGTFVETSSTFGKLWAQHLPRVNELFRYYEGRVYALDHETMGVSPFGNALTLVNALPKDARLHLATHSRGGIVAEALARICSGQGQGAEDLALFKANGYEKHRAELEQLSQQVRDKNIRVDRIVRIACPSRGTLLASHRLDAYLSVLKWGLEIAHVPVVPELIDFLSEVARRRTRPEELPGLESMMPGRPMARWLNAPAEPVSGDLRVIAGDIEGDSLSSWLKTLLSDAFFWTDNDLVVQTRSMYGGTLRTPNSATFALDRGGNVSHFNYFANNRTADLITSGLIQDRPQDFLPIGPLSWAGEDPSGTRGTRAVQRSRQGHLTNRPAVILLPAEFGSHLKVDGKRIWLGERTPSCIDQLRWQETTASRAQPDGLVGSLYDDIQEFLADTHEVVPFAYDWRKPLEEEARRLADEVTSRLAARKAPVRLLAHSMGGIVARTMQLERPDVWKELLSRAGARILLLGTPNAGCLMPMQLLSGDDTLGNLLGSTGTLFEEESARQMLAEMPGLLQLQAGFVNSQFQLGNRYDLSKESGWKALADADLAPIRARLGSRSLWHDDDLQVRALQWGVPPQAVLDRAVALRTRLNQQSATLAMDAERIVQVVGKAPLTPVDVRLEKNGLVYLEEPDGGDGKVSSVSACIQGLKTWQVDASHHQLADARHAFQAYLELLNEGNTSRLQPTVSVAAAARASGPPSIRTLVRSRPARGVREGTPPIGMADVFVRPEEGKLESPSRMSRLTVEVVNGNLKFVRRPLMLGHYTSLSLTGTEGVMDVLLGKAMSESLQAGLYPAEIGSNQIFINTARNPTDPFVIPRPEAVIVVGLGEEGQLQMSGIVDSVRQAALAYAQRTIERGAGGPTSFEVASTLIGSGGNSISTSTSAQAIVLGVQQANVRLAEVGWPLIAALQLIELHLDRAAEALQGLLALNDMQAQTLVVAPHIVAGVGGLPRPVQTGYRGANYDFVAVNSSTVEGNTLLEFSLSTQRARDEVRGVAAQSKLLTDLVESGATRANNPEIGRTLFKLLVPREMEPFLAGSTSLLMQLDPDSAAQPWELIDTRPSDVDSHSNVAPWAIRTRLLRKLRTPVFREHPRGAGRDAGVMVIGEPVCPAERYPRLPGAAAEAQAVAESFSGTAELLLQKEATEIVQKVLDRPYKIIHVAGHGDFIDDIGGVVLSNGTLLGPQVVEAMRTVPELVFVNCCFLGRFENDPSKKLNALSGIRSLPAFASNVAQKLIEIGVRCVLAAGWAVDDEPAKAFASRFYQELLHGRPFAEAVCTAREAIWRAYPNSNTWAAYQCYGDPGWRYVERVAQQPASPSLPNIDSPETLELMLKTMVASHAYRDDPEENVRSRIEQLAAGYGPLWGGQGKIAAAFGEAFAEVGEFDRAIDWYTRALGAEDGGATLHTMEQLGNVRVRHGATLADKELARKEIGAGIELLERLDSASASAERKSLLGSAYKRLASVEPHATARRQALSKALEHYSAAETIARDRKADNLFYPAMNRMHLALVLSAGHDTAGFDEATINPVRESLQLKNRDNPDFWSVVGVTELRMYEAVAKGALGSALEGIISDLKNLRSRARSERMWKSVADQAQYTLTPYMEKPETPKIEREAARKLLAELGVTITDSAEQSPEPVKKKTRPERQRIRGAKEKPRGGNRNHAR